MGGLKKKTASLGNQGAALLKLWKLSVLSSSYRPTMFCGGPLPRMAHHFGAQEFLKTSLPLVGDKFGESQGGSRAPPSFSKVSGLPWKFTVELNSNPEVPRKFSRLPGSSRKTTKALETEGSRSQRRLVTDRLPLSDCTEHNKNKCCGSLRTPERSYRTLITS